MSTTSPPHRVRRRRRPIVTAAVVAVGAAAAALPATASAETVTHPANQEFTAGASGWTATGRCTILGGLLGLESGGTTQPARRLLGPLLGPLLGTLLDGTPDGNLLDKLLGGLLGAGGDPGDNPGDNLLAQLLGGLLGTDLLDGLLGDLLGGPGGDLLDLDALIGGLLEDEGLVGGLLTGILGPNGLAGGLLGGLNQVLADVGVTCRVENSHAATGGNSGGALQTEVRGLLPNLVNALNLLGAPEATWRSGWFTYTQDNPQTVTFSLDARTQLAAILGERGFRVSASLEQLNGGTRNLGEWSFNRRDSTWTRRSATVPREALTTGGIYRIVLHITGTDTLNLVGDTPRIQLDNVRLTATTGDGGNNGGGGDNGGDNNGGGNGGGTGDSTGAGGLGACTPSNQSPPAAVGGGGSGTFTLSRQQLLINQRISQAGVRRVNAVIDKLTAGLTAADFQDCTIGPEKFSPELRAAIAAGQPAGPATGVEAPRRTPQRTQKAGNPGGVTLSARQLLINQRISQAAVRRVNAVQARLNRGLTAGDLRAGTLTPVKLNTGARMLFASALPAVGPARSPFVPLDIAPKGQGNPGRVTLSKRQLVINQRISQAAVRRVNAVQARLRTGLTGAAIKDGSLPRSVLTPGIQLGQR